MKINTQIRSCLIIIGLLSACSKDKIATALPAGSVTIQTLTTADTIGAAMSVAKDSLIVIGLKATLQGQPSATAHQVSFMVDTTKLAPYQAKYGNAVLLPSNVYFFYQPNCSIPAGATLSDSVEINFINETKLEALTTYVLPLTIGSVDGQTISAASGQVVYLVFHTGKSPFISKSGWTILSYSSDDGTHHPAALLDADDQNTTWSTGLFATMPQYVAIDFGKQVTFSGVTYRTPSDDYNGNFGFPKQIDIQLSTDGTNWTDMGTFGGQTSDATQTIDLGGLNTARYLKFTVTQVAPLITFQFLELGGIGLAP